jgi:hypothetical protein
MNHNEFMRSVQVAMLSHFNWWADREALTGPGHTSIPEVRWRIHARDKRLREGFAEAETFAGQRKGL